MSAENADALRLIEDTLAGIFATWIDRHGVTQILVDGDYDGITGRPIEAVAAEIDKAFGGLHREWNAAFADGGEFGCWDQETYDGVVAHRVKQAPLLRGQRRWVSGWSEVQP